MTWMNSTLLVLNLWFNSRPKPPFQHPGVLWFQSFKHFKANLVPLQRPSTRKLLTTSAKVIFFSFILSSLNLIANVSCTSSYQQSWDPLSVFSCSLLPTAILKPPASVPMQGFSNGQIKEILKVLLPSLNIMWFGSGVYRGKNQLWDQPCFPLLSCQRFAGTYLRPTKSPYPRHSEFALRLSFTFCSHQFCNCNQFPLHWNTKPERPSSLINVALHHLSKNDLKKKKRSTISLARYGGAC